MALLGGVSLGLTLYIGYRASVNGINLFSVSLLALFAGLFFESFRVSKDRITLLSIFMTAYLFSFFSFLPGKNESYYNFDSRIEIWPYVLIFFFALGFVLFHKDKVTAKLTEGLTLLQSLSLVYWTLDYGFTDYENGFTLSLLAPVFLFTAFALLNALTYFHLSATTRLALSIGSSIIMLAFAIDNILRVFNHPEIESVSFLSEGFFIGLQYFLLGVSAVYVMQNVLLLIAFLPRKNESYRDVLDEAQKEHLDRYSDQQVFAGHSLLCILYAVLFYGLNYRYQLLPRHTMIWFVFLTFPLLLQLIAFIYRRKTAATPNA